MSTNKVMSGGIMSFPHQKRSRSAKSTQFFKDCVEAGDILVGLDMDNGFRSTMRNKISNYNLVNNIVDPEEVKRVINPHNLEAEFTVNYKNYPLINSYMAVLQGEERELMFNPLVTMTNPDLLNIKLEEMTGILNQSIINQVMASQFNEEQAQKMLKEEYKYMKLNYRDRRERMASQVIQYGYIQQNMKELFSRAFEDLLIADEQLAVADIVGGEPVLRKINPLGFFPIRSSESYRIEESDVMAELSYIPVGQAIDEYHDELTPAQIKKLEEGYSFNVSASTLLFNRNLKNRPINLESWINQNGGIGSVIEANARQSTYLGGSFDEYGNVRRLRVVWKGMRKVGILPFLDEQGDQQKKYIDEDYPLTEDEKPLVKWIWIGEWYEGTKLGDDIFVKLGPRPVQFRSMENPSKCSSGIVGNIYNTNSSRAMSFVSLHKDYQLAYNYFMHKLLEELKTYKGKVARLNTSLIPDSFTMDQFLFYIDQLKIAFEDPFNEGRKGAAMGKLAGNLNQNQGAYEFGDPQIIQNLLAVLQFIENRLQDSTGITPQRKGAITNQETVGGVERSVKQSSLNTAKYYAIHEDFRIRAITAYLETAKVAWKGQKFKRQFVLSDGSQALLDFDGDIFPESEYGVYTTSAMADKEMMQTLRSMVQPFMQNGGTMSMVMELYRTQDPATLQRKFEAFEEQIRQEQAEQQKQQMQIQQEANQLAAQAEQAKLDMDKYKADLDSNTKIEVALIQAESSQTTPIEDDSISEADSRRLDLQKETLSETIRKNKKAEALKEQEIAIKKKQANAKKSTSN